MKERHNYVFSKNEINTGDDYLANFEIFNSRLQIFMQSYEGI